MNIEKWLNEQLVAYAKYCIESNKGSLDSCIKQNQTRRRIVNKILKLLNK